MSRNDENMNDAYQGAPHTSVGTELRRQRAHNGANSSDASFTGGFGRKKDRDNSTAREHQVEGYEEIAKAYMSKTSNQAGKLTMKSKSPINRQQTLGLNHNNNKA